MPGAATITRDLIAWINGLGADLAGVHVGEVVPQSVDQGYIWIEQGAEVPQEGYCNDTDIIGYAVNCISDDINQCRTITQALKDSIRSRPAFEAPLDYCQYMEVADAGDESIYKDLEDDGRRFVGGLSLVLYLGA